MDNESRKQEFLELLKTVVEKTEEIDANTVWEESEPDWWIMMMTIQRLSRQYLS